MKNRTCGRAVCFLAAGIFFGMFFRMPACAASGGEGLADVIASPFHGPLRIFLFLLIFAAIAVTVFLIYLLGKKGL